MLLVVSATVPTLPGGCAGFHLMAAALAALSRSSASLATCCRERGLVGWKREERRKGERKGGRGRGKENRGRGRDRWGEGRMEG